MNTYFLKCDRCNFKRISDGSESSISDLRQVVLCSKCSGPKTFKCPGCGFVIKAKRWIAPPTPKEKEEEINKMD